jgi:hypothetical protein
MERIEIGNCTFCGHFPTQIISEGEGENMITRTKALPSPMYDRLVAEARGLHDEDAATGRNDEYDRALIELIYRATGVDEGTIMADIFANSPPAQPNEPPDFSSRE